MTTNPLHAPLANLLAACDRLCQSVDDQAEDRDNSEQPDVALHKLSAEMKVAQAALDAALPTT